MDEQAIILVVLEKDRFMPMTTNGTERIPCTTTNEEENIHLTMFLLDSDSFGNLTNKQTSMMPTCFEEIRDICLDKMI